MRSSSLNEEHFDFQQNGNLDHDLDMVEEMEVDFEHDAEVAEMIRAIDSSVEQASNTGQSSRTRHSLDNGCSSFGQGSSGRQTSSSGQPSSSGQSSSSMGQSTSPGPSTSCGVTSSTGTVKDVNSRVIMRPSGHAEKQKVIILTTMYN